MKVKIRVHNVPHTEYEDLKIKLNSTVQDLKERIYKRRSKVSVEDRKLWFKGEEL